MAEGGGAIGAGRRGGSEIRSTVWGFILLLGEDGLGYHGSPFD